jgi:hypothetical protein
MSQLIDVTGLPPESVRIVDQLVQELRQTNGSVGSESPSSLPVEERIRLMNEWSERHPIRQIEIDDRRETIYAERG